MNNMRVHFRCSEHFRTENRRAAKDINSTNLYKHLYCFDNLQTSSDVQFCKIEWRRARESNEQHACAFQMLRAFGTKIEEEQKDGYSLKTVQKLLLLGQFSRYSLNFWHADF